MKFLDDNVITVEQKQLQHSKEEHKKEESEDFGKTESSVDEKYKEISTFNGDKNDKYSWSQDCKNVTVSIPLERASRGKDITVEWHPKSLHVY